MRIKKKTWILTFESTTQAMAADKFGIEQKLPGRLIPIPREITAVVFAGKLTQKKGKKC